MGEGWECLPLPWLNPKLLLPESHETQCPELTLQAHSPFFPPHPPVFSLSQPRAAWRDRFSLREEQVGESGARERLLLGKR